MIELPSSRRSLMWFLQFQQFNNQRKWRLIFLKIAFQQFPMDLIFLIVRKELLWPLTLHFCIPEASILHPALISSLTLTLRYNSFSVGFYPVSRIFQEYSPSIWWKNFNAMIVSVWKSGNTGKLYLLLMNQ